MPFLPPFRALHIGNNHGSVIVSESHTLGANLRNPDPQRLCPMYLAALFALLLAALVAAAFGPMRLAGLLTVASFLAAVLVYLHHATDPLPLSF